MERAKRRRFGPGLYLTLETTRWQQFAVRTGPVDARHRAAGTQKERTVIAEPDAGSSGRKAVSHWCIVSCEVNLSQCGNQGQGT